MAVSRINEAGLNVNQYGNRNLVINGGMQVAQRGSVAALQTGYGACDRFKLASNSAARFDTTQSTDVPSGQGFANSLKLDCSTADTSVAAGDYYFIQQLIEGQNLQQLAYGTSSAKQMTLSFWVKSPKTGIHNLEVESADGGVFNIHQYTIASANTWQNVKMTIDGYQTTAIANDDTAGLNINWWLLGGTTFSGGSYSENTWTSSNGNRAVGQVNVSDSTSNDFYITGVQLEVGDTATDFEHRSYGDEVVKCQRYFNYVRHGGTASNAGLSNSYGNYFPQAPMRNTPTATAVGADPLTAANFTAYPGGASVSVIINALFEAENGNISVRPYINGNGTYTYLEGFMSLDAEL